MKAFKRVSKRWRFGFVVFYVLALLSPFFSSVSALSPNVAQAANFTVPVAFQNGHWAFIDRVHVGFFPTGATTAKYIVSDNALDTEIQYHNDPAYGISSSGNGDVCALHVEVAHDHTTDSALGSQQDIAGKLSPLQLQGLNPIQISYKIYSGFPQNKCGDWQTYNVNVAQSDLVPFNVIFTWTAPNQVTRVDAYNDGTQVYIQRPTGTPNSQVQFQGQTFNVFVKQNSVSGVSCPSILLAPPNPSDVSVGYYEEIGTSGSGGGLDTGTGPKSRVFPTGNPQCYIQVDGGGHNKAGFLLINGYSAIAGKPLATGNTKIGGDGGTSCAVTEPISFIACPFIDLAQNFYSAASSQVVTLLNNGALSTSNPGYQSAFQIWTAFKNLTNIVFVLVFLFIIFSTTLSLGLSNYDVKKILPRLVVAVILVQFSWVLMQLAFDVSNILAAGISALPVFSSIKGAQGGTTTTAVSYVVAVGISTIFVAASVAAGLIIPFLLLLLSAVIGILAVFLTLFIRQFIIIIMVILAPLAFVAWVLPNTEGFFKTWSKLFLRLLFMYPLVVLIFAVAGLFSKVTPACTVGSKVAGYKCTDLNSVFGAIIPILAFYMVPWTFKWAGGAMASVGGWVSARGAGISKAASSPAKKRWSEYTSARGTKALQERQTKAAELYSKDTRLSKTRARALLPGYGNNRLAALAKKAQVEQISGERDKLGLSLQGLEFTEQNRRLNEILSTSKDTYQRQASMEAMLDRGMVGGYDPTTNTYGLAGIAEKDVAAFDSDPAWQRLKQDKFDDISKKAGFLLSDKPTMPAKINDFASKASYEQMASIKSGALGMINDYKANGALDPAAVAELRSKAQTVLGTPRLMQGVKGGEEAELRKL